MRKLFPLNKIVNSEKGITIFLVGMIYVISSYLVRLLLSLIPFFKFGFNLLAAIFTFYCFFGIVYAISDYIKKK